MKIELNKTYTTKRGIQVKITMKTSFGFFGTLQDNSKRLVKYNENGRVEGWSLGNMLDIKGSETPEELTHVSRKSTTHNEYLRKYEANQKKLEEIKKTLEKNAEVEEESPVEEAEETKIPTES